MNRLNGDLEQHDFAYLTTSGRVTGQPHRVEIWFVIVDGFLWVNSGGGRRSDWVKNLIGDPRVVVEVGNDCWSGTGTLRDDLAEHPARKRLAARYQGWSEDQPLSQWATESLLIRFEVDRAC
ncbi:MAG: hypothetical protein BMS9Abin17_1599 [Acidimicrobiia bacterium]|nr:MAG: hypothetical protein BMS9Abin17_1599 [Acidimicrobiia bacterium]